MSCLRGSSAFRSLDHRGVDCVAQEQGNMQTPLGLEIMGVLKARLNQSTTTHGVTACSCTHANDLLKFYMKGYIIVVLSKSHAPLELCCGLGSEGTTPYHPCF